MRDEVAIVINLICVWRGAKDSNFRIQNLHVVVRNQTKIIFVPAFGPTSFVPAFGPTSFVPAFGPTSFVPAFGPMSGQPRF